MSATMSPDEQILRANRDFYRALCQKDLSAMERLWLHEPWVRCVHPGWQLLSGWESVRDSWRRIFANPEGPQVEVSGVTIRVFHPVGWVSCLEHIAAPGAAEVSIACGTNLFISTPSGWKMFLHHASPVAGEIIPSGGQTIH